MARLVMTFKGTFCDFILEGIKNGMCAFNIFILWVNNQGLDILY